jgi:hypothetical protein
MWNTQDSCYRTVSNQSPHLPMLVSPAEPTTIQTEKSPEDDGSRGLRLFGRPVRLSICGGPCAKRDVIEMAFAEGAVAL